MSLSRHETGRLVDAIRNHVKCVVLLTVYVIISTDVQLDFKADLVVYTACYLPCCPVARCQSICQCQWRAPFLSVWFVRLVRLLTDAAGTLSYSILFASDFARRYFCCWLVTPCPLCLPCSTLHSLSPSLTARRCLFSRSLHRPTWWRHRCATSGVRVVLPVSLNKAAAIWETVRLRQHEDMTSLTWVLHRIDINILTVFE